VTFSLLIRNARIVDVRVGDVSLGDFADANVDDACVSDEEREGHEDLNSVAVFAGVLSGCSESVVCSICMSKRASWSVS